MNRPADVACLALIACVGVVAAVTHAPPGGKLRGDPRAIGWEDKNAYLKCQAAIDGRQAWPHQPEAACNAMLMCADEANLSPSDYQRLVEKARRLAGCGEP